MSDESQERLDRAVAVLTGKAAGAEFAEDVWFWVRNVPAVKQFFSFRHLKDDVRLNLCASLRLITAARGTVLYQQAETGTSFYIVVGGKVEVRHHPISMAEARELDKAYERMGDADLGSGGGVLGTMQRTERMGILVGTLGSGSCFGDTTAGIVGEAKPRLEHIAAAGGSKSGLVGPVPEGSNVTHILQVDMAAYKACSRLKFRGKQLAISKRVAALQLLHWFKDWPLGELEFLCGYARDQKLSEGSELYAEGDPSDSVFVLVNGSVGITGSHPDSPEVRVNIEHVTAPSLFGEMELLAGEEGWDNARSFTATTLADSTVVAIPARMFSKLVLSPLAAKAYNTKDYLDELAARRHRWSDSRLEHAVEVTSGLGGVSVAQLPVPFAFTDSTQARMIPCAVCGEKLHASEDCPTNLRDDAEAAMPTKKAPPAKPAGKAPPAKPGAAGGSGTPKAAAQKKRPQKYVVPKTKGIRGRVDANSMATWKTADYEKRMHDSEIQAAIAGGLAAAAEDEEEAEDEGSDDVDSGKWKLEPGYSRAVPQPKPKKEDDWNAAPKRTLTDREAQLELDAKQSDAELQTVLHAVVAFKNLLSNRRVALDAARARRLAAAAKTPADGAKGKEDLLDGRTLKGVLLPGQKKERRFARRSAPKKMPTRKPGAKGTTASTTTAVVGGGDTAGGSGLSAIRRLSSGGSSPSSSRGKLPTKAMPAKPLPTLNTSKNQAMRSTSGGAKSTSTKARRTNTPQRRRTATGDVGGSGLASSLPARPRSAKAAAREGIGSETTGSATRAAARASAARRAAS